MENNQLLPFERNRYYIGKLLTSTDFLAEQTYLNNKRRFINSVMFGEGVVCGLGVYNLDDLSIMVESGVAIDGLGREIVVENVMMKKLSAIEGFEALTGDCATLCLRYNEEPVHPVYSIARQESGEEEYELNRIREGFRIFLTDSDSLAAKAELPSEFLSEVPLYADSDYSVMISIPSVVSCSSLVKVTVAVQKLSAASRNFSLDCTLQTPAFVNAAAEHELTVKIEDILPAQGETVRREFWLTAQAQPAPESLIVAKSGFIKILIDGQHKRAEDNALLKVSVSDTATRDLIEAEIGKISLETRQQAGQHDFIRLADFHLQRTKNAYIIEKIVERGVKRYIRTAATEMLRREYGAYFDKGKAPDAVAHVEDADHPALSAASFRDPIYASGVCEIPLGTGARKGDIVYSDEIMHGLGKGNIFVNVGFEFLSEGRQDGQTVKNTIYGDAELFAKEDHPISYAQTAVKVFNERGSFVIAAKLTRQTSFVVIVLRWVAIRLPAADDQSLLHKLAGKSISVVTPTAVIATRESHYFQVRFKNMEPCTLTYELMEKDSGEITSDGTYTAPAKEGVYEIRISCADMPLVSTYAYAVVKKRQSEDESVNT